MVEAKNAKSRKKLPLRKIILLVISPLVLILVVTSVFAYSRYLHPTGEIMPDLYAVRSGGNGVPLVNFFLLKVDDGYIAFDSGANNTQTKNELQKLDISSDDVIAVFITHGDHDHIGSLSLFSNATIHTGIIELTDYPHEIMPDGEIIDIYGIPIQIIYTPGHTNGCAIYLVDGRLLFVGDLLINPNRARYDAELQRLNIEKALQIDGVEYVFTGHFGLFMNIRFFRWWF